MTIPQPQKRGHDRLTALTVRNLSERGMYPDGDGLYLQVAPGGSKSWILRYTMAKQTRAMGLGSAKTFSLAEARTRARKFRQQVADGIDPIDQRTAQTEELVAARAKREQAARTFAEVAHEYHQANASDWKNVKHAAQWINTLTTYAFPHFGSRAIGDVGIEDVRTALLPIWKDKAESASRVAQRIRTVINYAAARNYCAGLDRERWDQLKFTLPKNKAAREVKHHASCPHSEVGELLQKVLTSTSSPAVRLAFAFIVLTAARSGEVRGATWGEIHVERRLWVILGSRMKAGREHTVPLSDAAWDVLEQAKALHGDAAAPDQLVFANPRGQSFSDMTFTQVLRRMKQPWTMHGFRASFRTWGAEIAHYDHDVLEVALSHIVGDATVRAYQRSDMVEKRRRLMQDWASYMVVGEVLTLAAT